MVGAVQEESTPAPAYPVHTRCLVCGSPDLAALQGYERCYLTRCEACRFVFVSRVPTPKELDEHYSLTYRENEQGYEWLSPVTSKRFDEWLEMMAPYRGERSRILDVGCGVGHFLVHAQQRGWEAHGTEYPEYAVEICRRHGIEMHAGPLRPENYEPESFDVVTSLGVIEHINNPLDEVRKIHALLRPGGLCWVTTPNWNSLS
ncbi:MAG: class I SAM-dependent methyltransferase, partial [Actinobacteria bacterium]|nr:class I SAM-dependent methyltransferase [Actinomycetota bacterium]